MSLIGFGTGGGPTVSTEVFVQIPTWKDKKQPLTSRRRRLAFGTKEQRGAKRLELLGLALRNRWTAGSHPVSGARSGRKGWHRHDEILAKTPHWVKKPRSISHSCRDVPLSRLLPHSSLSTTNSKTGASIIQISCFLLSHTERGQS